MRYNCFWLVALFLFSACNKSDPYGEAKKETLIWEQKAATIYACFKPLSSKPEAFDEKIGSLAQYDYPVANSIGSVRRAEDYSAKKAPLGRSTTNLPFRPIIRIGSAYILSENLDFEGVVTYYVYDTVTQQRYVWLTWDWAHYVMHTDSSFSKKYEWQTSSFALPYRKMHYTYTIPSYMHYASPPEKQAIVEKMQKDNYSMEKGLEEGFLQKLEAPIEKEPYYTWHAYSDSAFHAFSIAHTFPFSVLDSIVSCLRVDSSYIDTALQYLQSTSSYDVYISGCHWNCNKSIDVFPSGKKILHYERYDCQYMPYEERITAAFERISLLDLAKMELVYHDGKIEKMTAIADYAKYKNPTFMYFKRRNNAYYFLFYYLDHHWLWGWRLRDMEVVFPRRFLAQAR